MRNGGLEASRTVEDLWDGVDSQGNLTGERGQAPVLSENGDIEEAPLPVSIGLADMNGDGLLDIVMMDVVGYLKIYFNSGTKTEPKFEQAELAAVYLSRVALSMTPNRFASFYVRSGPRLSLVDSERSGKFDLYVGNYWGEVFYLRNSGTSDKPLFQQPEDPEKLLIPTTKDPTIRWGNLFAPAAWDWNGDGKLDLLVGEGSYSANNIHLLINSGSNGRPIFEESNRTVLAFGDGREQLTPAVVDYNGDGQMDLLVAERTGKLALYLNKGTSWKPGEELPFATNVAPLSFGGIFTVATGDLNGDGLFDLAFGKSNGRIAVCYNSGAKTEPKFAPPLELKGGAPSPSMKWPVGWDIDIGLDRGNFFGFASLVTNEEDPEAQVPEGKTCLKFGYRLCPNKILLPPTSRAYSPAYPDFNRSRPLLGQNLDKSMLVLRDGPANVAMLRAASVPLKAAKTYTLSFRVKGAGATTAQVAIGWQAVLALSESKVTALDRGVKVEENKVQERGEAVSAFSISGQWTEVKKDFNTTFREKRLNIENLPSMRGVIEITFALQPMVGKIYIDDIRLTAK